MIENKRLLQNDLYLHISLSKSENKLYKDCNITMAIKQSKGNTPLESDKDLFKKSVNRSVPRVTFNGNERCRRAIKDAFVHIPVCKSIGYAGEKK